MFSYEVQSLDRTTVSKCTRSTVRNWTWQLENVDEKSSYIDKTRRGMVRRNERKRQYAGVFRHEN